MCITTVWQAFFLGFSLLSHPTLGCSLHNKTPKTERQEESTPRKNSTPTSKGNPRDKIVKTFEAFLLGCKTHARPKYHHFGSGIFFFSFLGTKKVKWRSLYSKGTGGGPRGASPNPTAYQELEAIRTSLAWDTTTQQRPALPPSTCERGKKRIRI